jgi:hypothetical protein
MRCQRSGLGEGTVCTTGRVQLQVMERSACHENVAKLWRQRLNGITAVGTGYALTPDDLWRQHSWGVGADHAIIETTALRSKYFGILLYGDDADSFADANLPAPAQQSRRDLDVPPEVEADVNAREVFRAWAANGGLSCALRPETWADRGAWGLVLADAARHIGNAIAELDGTNPATTVDRIRQVFNQELDTRPMNPPATSIDSQTTVACPQRRCGQVCNFH